MSQPTPRNWARGAAKLLVYLPCELVVEAGGADAADGAGPTDVDVAI